MGKRDGERGSEGMVDPCSLLLLVEKVQWRYLEMLPGAVCAVLCRRVVFLVDRKDHRIIRSG